MRLRDIIPPLLARPIAFHPILAKICGGDVAAGVFLSQCMYWIERTTDPDGWFYKTAKDWQQETCLTRHQQDRIREHLSKLGFLQCEVMGVPGTVHFRLDVEAICRAISQFVEKQQPSLPESGKLERRKAANSPAAKRRTESPESGKPYKEAETTTETTQRLPQIGGAASAPSARAPVILLPLNDGTDYPITQSHVDEWSPLYPAVDVMQQLREMRGWLLANSKNRKTRDGVLRFVTRWLAKEQDEAPVAPERPAQKPQIKLTYRLPAGLDEEEGREAWGLILDHLSGKVNKHSFETWLRPTRAAGVHGRVLYVRVPTVEFLHIGEKYKDLIAEVIAPMPLSRVEFVAPTEAAA